MRLKSFALINLLMMVFSLSCAAGSIVELLFVDDIGSVDSQFAGVVDFPNGLSNNRGNVHSGMDIEVMDSYNGMVYAISGDQGDQYSSLYMVNPSDGMLTLVYDDVTDGSNEVVAGSFRPGTSEFWVVVKNIGISVIDVENPGYAALHSNNGHNWEGLAWNTEGNKLYGSRNRRFYEYDPFGGNNPSVLTNLASSISKSIEGIEFDPYGNLILAAKSSIYRIDGIGTSNITATQIVSYDGRDIESLTFVPEPATVAILAMGSLLVIGKRR